ncbi:MAG: tetratricopeptide repeat protein [Sideroxyarcus sp.]|nr:tetratricopeptide repeat protein [Sideroxyarcus sp.]
MFKLFSRAAALGLLLAISIPVQADDLQDANKLFKQGLHAQAMEKVNTYLVAKPKDAQARFLKGLIFAEQANIPDAITTFTGLTEDYPELPEPYNNLAVLYAGQGNYEKAKSSLEMAIRTHPSYATAHENLGDIYAKMASQAYDRALQLDKSNTNTQTKLALIRELFSKSVRTPVAAKPTVTAQAGSAPATAPATTTAVVAAASAPVVAQPAQTKPVVTVVALDADISTEVLKATKEWAAAWSAKNSKKYLALYAKEFKAPDGLSRSAWEAQRKARIAAPKSIQIGISEAKVKVSDEKHASITFRQSYRASHLNSLSAKTLDWAKVDGQWLIVAERSGK